MKKILLIQLCILASFLGSAQVISKGEKFIGGSIGGHFTNNYQGSDQRNTNVGLLPALSFAVKDNLVFGVRGNLGYTRNENIQLMGNMVQSNVYTGIGIFLKKYRPFENRFGFNFEHGINTFLNFFNTKDPANNESRSSNWGAGYHFHPGVFYRFSEKFLGEANIGGVAATYTNGGAASHTFSVGASFLQHFNLGINYRFGRKKAADE